MDRHVQTTVGLTGSIYLEHPVSGYRIDRFDKVVSALRACDVTLANFEACIASERDWPAFSAGAVGSGTYMGGTPSTIDEMKYMGIDALYAGSNHVADFGELGILTTIEALRARDMPFAGIGASLTEASAPCYVETPGGRRVAVISLCDWGPRGLMDMLFPWPHGYLASDELPPFRSRPGINLLRYGVETRVDRKTLDELRRASGYLGWEKSKALRRTGMMRDYPVIYGEEPDCEVDTDDEFFFMGRKFVAAGDGEGGDPPGSETFAYLADVERIVKFVREARRQADVVVVALHDQSLRQGGGVHEYIRTAAYAAVDAGADIFVNTGGLQRGIEIYNGKVVLWGLPMLYLQNNQISRLPSSSYAYWKLPPDSTVADLLEVRASRAKPRPDGPQQTAVYPLMPAALYSVVFDDANQAREVRIQPFALDPDAPRYRRDLPLWPDDAEAAAMVAGIIGLSEPFGTEVVAEDGVAVAKIK
jgi:poly-gamma-glutamate capsule biosynthesis protein CapA/YwtB (metallophosphatase superfamily)